MRSRRDLQFHIDVALAALFLAALFALGIATLCTDGAGARDAFTVRRRVTEFLDDPARSGRWDTLAARVRSLDDYLADHLCCDAALNHFNAALQRALGKRLIQGGEHPLLLLDGGQLYEPRTEYTSMRPAAREVLALRDAAGEVPLLFCYIHPGPCDESGLPPGWAAADRSAEMADELLDLLAEEGVPTLDSRNIIRRAGLSPNQYLLRSDNHWTTRAALEAARSAAAAAARLTGAPLRSELLDAQAFETRTYPNLFLGSYGQRVGPAVAAPDDITLYWPRYATDIRRRSDYLGERTDVRGEFRESAIRWRYLRAPQGQSWNTVAHFAYGLTENWDFYENPAAADCTILLVKDSYGAAMGSFLSLVANEVCAVDPRRSERTPREWIDALHPDLVIAALSLPYLLNEAGEFE